MQTQAALIICGIFLTIPLCAQPASGLPPLTYDYNAAAPGVQPPSFLLGAPYDYRSVRTYQVSIPVLVPRSELQALMPAGFTAVATPSGSTNGTVTLAFFLDQRFEVGGQTYGPVSAMLVSTTAFNTAANRNELVFPSFQASGHIGALNIAFGPGSARAATVGVAITQAGGRMRFEFDIADAGLGLKLRAEAEAPAAMNNRAISDPVGLAFRTFNGLSPNNAFRAASQSDALVVPAQDANVKLHATGNRLNFPAGSLSIVGVGASVTFSRGVEFVLKFE